MLGLAEYERSLCHTCRHNLADTLDPRNEGRFQVSQVLRCHGCDALIKSQEEYGKKSPRPGALIHVVELDQPGG